MLGLGARISRLEDESVKNPSPSFESERGFAIAVIEARVDLNIESFLARVTMGSVYHASKDSILA